MSDGLTPILPSLPCLCRGQLLHLCNSLLVPAPQSLPWHGDKDHPLPPAGLTSLSHLPVVGSVQGSASLGGCLSDQLGLEGVDLRTEIMCTQQLQLCQPASASQIAATELINNYFLYK